MISYRHPANASGGEEGEPLSLERAEELARELGIHPQGIRRMMERASRAEWHERERKLVFTFPEPEPSEPG